ncbi:MAG: formyltransferase family protein [Nitrospinota bacterium]|nr:formyltransferase family protein [Nitrospinota bacterium]
MNITVLTNKDSLYGKKIILDLVESGLAMSIVVINQSLPFKLKLFRSVAKKVGWVDTFRLALKQIRDNKNEYKKISKEKPKLLKDYSQFCKNIAFSNGTNSLETEYALQKFKTDLLILGQAGIVKQNILQIPKIGTLNGHPGILPFYRGVDCPHWALLNGEFDKIGASIHWVDQGVDTGKIIATEKFPVKGIKDVSILEESIYTLCSKMLTKIVVEFEKGNYPDGTTQLINEGRQYYKISCKQFKSLETILQGL